MRVRVRSFSEPNDRPILLNAIQIGFIARVMDGVFQYDGSIRSLDGFVDFCVQGLDFHLLSFLRIHGLFERCIFNEPIPHRKYDKQTYYSKDSHDPFKGESANDGE